MASRPLPFGGPGGLEAARHPHSAAPVEVVGWVPGAPGVGGAVVAALAVALAVGVEVRAARRAHFVRLNARPNIALLDGKADAKKRRHVKPCCFAAVPPRVR